MRDYESEFSRKQAVTSTAVSDNVVKVPMGDIGKGRPVVLQVYAVPYTGGGDITVEVETADAADMTGSETIATYAIPNGKLVKGGSVLAAGIPTGAKQYIRLNYEVNGTLADGAITSGLQLHGDTATM